MDRRCFMLALACLPKHRHYSHLYMWPMRKSFEDLQYTIMEYIEHILISTKSKVKNPNHISILDDILEFNHTDGVSRLSRVLKYSLHRRKRESVLLKEKPYSASRFFKRHIIIL